MINHQRPIANRVIFLVTLFLSCFQNLFSQPSVAEWKVDLEQLVTSLEKHHPDPYHHISKEVFYDSLELTKKRISSDPIANQIHMIKLISLLRDRHTNLDPNAVFENWLPLSIYKFEDGFYIISTIKKYKAFLGAKVLRFEGIPSNQVFHTVADMHASDNDIGRDLNTYYMSSLDVLKHYDINNSNKSISLQIQLDNGEQQTIVIEGVQFPRKLQNVLDLAEFFGPMDDNISSEYVMAYEGINIKDYYNQPHVEKKDMPHFLRHRRGYWFDYIEPNKTMYIAICYSTHNGRNGFDSFNDFLNKVFFEIDNNPIDKVILDVRFNPGGDGSITLPLVHEFIKRDNINVKGKLFTLIGRKTYSAAQMIYAEMLKHTNTVLIGEPAGAPVNGYGDPTSINLSNSNMHFQISTAYWQMGHPNDSSWVQKVDIPIVFTSEDYIHGKDRAIDYILDLKESYLSLPEFLKQHGISEFKKEYNHRKENFGRYEWWQPFEERDMRYISRDLFDAGEVEKGTIGFEILIEMYPNSWRAYRDYAERLIKIKDTAQALEIVTAGLEVNPNSSDLKDLLSQLN